MSKVSQNELKNLWWYHDYKNPKNVLNMLSLFESHLDVESNRIFADFKVNTVKEFMERGYNPNTLMSDISKASENYNILKTMFKLQ